MQLLDYIDHVNMHPLIVDLRRRDYLYASDASMKVENLWDELEPVGGCLRAQWYRLKGKGCEQQETPESIRRMDYGSAIHEYEYERMKIANIFVASEVSFHDPARKISGRVDVFVYNPFSETEPKEVFGIDVKTVGGYKTVKDTILSANKEPKPDHVLTTMVYADFYKDLVKTWFLFYFDRETGRKAQHTIVLTDNGVSVNGQERPWKVENIYSRWKLLEEMLESDNPPPRDYEIRYSPDKIKVMMERQQLSKSELAEVKKGRMVDRGHWRCKWCRHRTLCYDNT